MTTLALVSAFPPSKGSLNEYGYHLANALADRSDVDRLIILADRHDGPEPERELSPKIEIRRVWRFNQWRTPFAIAAAAQRLEVDGVVFNLQTASFGDKEIAAALGLMAPAMTQFLGRRTGVIAHNLIDAMDVEKAAIGKAPLRAGIIRLAGKVVTRGLLEADYVTVTLDGFADILEKKYGARNAFMVPHGTFPAAPFDLRPIAERAPSS